MSEPFDEPLVKSTFSQGVGVGRKEVLWNVQEPGDPYDIRKSMIAKFPGTRDTFMGEHVELICLLQAAEIERLCQFLEDYKLKYREIQRGELDRHSYEIQIKELTEQLSDEGFFKNENNKLKDFIKKQTTELQQLKTLRHGTDSNLKTNYDNALRQIQVLMNENNGLRADIDNRNGQIQNLNYRIEALQTAKNRQIQELKLKLQEIGNLSYESQLLTVKNQYENQMNSLQMDLKRLREINETKNSEIERLMLRVQDCQKQIQQISGSSQTRYTMQTRLAEYENRFIILGQEIDRLNLVIKDTTSKIEQSEMRKRDAEKSVQNMRNQYYELQSKVRLHETQIIRLQNIIAEYDKNLGRKSPQIQYEQKMNEMSYQIQNLNIKLKNQVQRHNTTKDQLNRLSYNNSMHSILQKENNELKIKLNDTDRLKIELAQKKNKLSFVTQELERVSNRLNILEFESNKQSGVAAQNDELKSKLRDLELSTSRQHEQEKQKIIREYQIKIQQLMTIANNSNEATQKAAALSQELDRVSNLLRARNSQNQELNRKIQDLEYSITQKYHVQGERKISALENTIATLRRENENYGKRLRELQDSNRRMSQYESKYVLLERQNDRLNKILINRDSDREAERQNESRKYSSYEQRISNLSNQNEELRRKFQDLSGDAKKNSLYESKLLAVSQQIDRLSQQLTTKNQQIKQLESKNRNLSIELQNIQRRINQYQISINKYQQDYSTLGRENEELRRKLKDSGEYSRRIMEYENKIVLLSHEIQRLNSKLGAKAEEAGLSEQNVRVLSAQNEDLNRQIKELAITISNKYEMQAKNKVYGLQQSINQLRRDNEQMRRVIQQNENQKKLQSSEYEIMKNRLREFQGGVRNYQMDVSRKVQNYENSIKMIRKENEQLRIRIQEVQRMRMNVSDYQNRMRAISDDNQKLTINLHNSNQEIQKLKMQLNQSNQTIYQKYNIEFNQKISIYQQKINTYEQKIGVLVGESEELKKKLMQSSNQIYQLRRQNNQVKGNNEELRRKINFDGRNQGAEQETKIALMAQQIQRLKGTINMRNEEMGRMQTNYRTQIDNLRKQLKQQDVSVSNRYRSQYSQKIMILEQNITTLRRQNEELRNRINQSGNINKKAVEYDNKIAMLSQQIERLNSVLKVKVDEESRMQSNYRNQIEELRRQIREKQVGDSRYQSEINKASKYQQTIYNLNNEIQELHRKLNYASNNNNLIVEYENKIAILKQDIERLNYNNRQQMQENRRLHDNNDSLSKELNSTRNQYQRIITQLKQDRHHIQHSQLQSKYNIIVEQYQSSKKNLIEYGQSIQKLYVQFERLQTIINELKKQRQNLRQKNHGLSNEIDRLTQFSEDLEKQLYEIRLKLSDDVALQKRINEQLALMVVLFAEIETLRQRVRDKQKEVQEVRRSSLIPLKV